MNYRLLQMGSSGQLWCVSRENYTINYGRVVEERTERNLTVSCLPLQTNSSHHHTRLAERGTNTKSLVILMCNQYVAAWLNYLALPNQDKALWLSSAEAQTSLGQLQRNQGRMSVMSGPLQTVLLSFTALELYWANFREPIIFWLFFSTSTQVPSCCSCLGEYTVLPKKLIGLEVSQLNFQFWVNSSFKTTKNRPP